MRLQTKRTLLRVATAAAVACTAAMIFLPAAASARPAPSAMSAITFDTPDNVISSLRVR